MDLDAGSPDIQAAFNSSIDNNNDDCLAGTNWYYGLDGNTSGDIDLFQVVLHELGHGMGFLTLLDGQTGTLLLNKNDIFMVFLQDMTQNQTWPNLSDAQRMASATNNGNLVWSGATVTSMAGGLSSGVHPSGFVRMYAPTTYNEGSSISHWDTTLFPNQLMEPQATGDTRTIGLAYELMIDLGWPVNTIVPTPTATLPPGPTPTPTDPPTVIDNWKLY
jgi:hypothetical protein